MITLTESGKAVDSILRQGDGEIHIQEPAFRESMEGELGGHYNELARAYSRI